MIKVERRLRVGSVHRGERREDDFDFLVIALPHSHLASVTYRGERLAEALRQHHAHYDCPAHYLRITILFEQPFWRDAFSDSYWMLDQFGGCCLWVNGQQSRGRSDLEISKVSVRRGLFVFGIGFGFNILVWLPEDTFNWDVLTFVGTALLLLNVLRRIPLTISVVVAVLALLVSPILRKLVDYGTYSENGYFECDLTLTDVFIGFLVTGCFPVFPWIAFSLSGFVTASHLFGESPEPSFPPPQAAECPCVPCSIFQRVLIA